MPQLFVPIKKSYAYYLHRGMKNRISYFRSWKIIFYLNSQWKSSTTSSLNIKSIWKHTPLSRTLSSSAKYSQKSISLTTDMITLETGSRPWGMAHTASCSPLGKIKFYPSIKALGVQIPITVKELSIQYPTQPLQRKCSGPWKVNGPMESFMAKVVSVTPVWQTNNGKLAMKGLSKTGKSQVSELKEVRIVFIEVIFLKVAELEKEGWS